MLTSEQIERRKPLWQAFSDLWLDNELQDFEIKHIINLIKNSEFGFQEIEKIFYSEVAPVVYKNSFSMTGEWAGFDSEWLFRSIIESIEKQETNLIYKTWVNSSAGRFLMTKMVKDDWEKIIQSL